MENAIYCAWSNIHMHNPGQIWPVQNAFWPIWSGLSMRLWAAQSYPYLICKQHSNRCDGRRPWSWEKNKQKMNKLTEMNIVGRQGKIIRDVSNGDGRYLCCGPVQSCAVIIKKKKKQNYWPTTDTFVTEYARQFLFWCEATNKKCTRIKYRGNNNFML